VTLRSMWVLTGSNSRHNRVAYFGRSNRSTRELADHLGMIIRREQNMEIPDKPPVDLPQHCPLPILGTLTDEVRQLDMKYFESEERIREVAKKLRLKREARGEESGMYAYLQPPETPTLDELMGKRIDVCWPYIIGDNKKKDEQEYEYWWCQGKVIEKVSNVPQTVKLLWDAMPDLDEDNSISNQVLQPNKWKKKSKFGWRTDIDVEMFENYHDTVDNNDDAEDNMNVNVIDDDDKDDENSDSDSDDEEESVLDYGTDSSESDSD
jgi:hypothetical protein